MVFALRMVFQFLTVEVDLTQVPGAIPLGLIIEVQRIRVTALASRGHRSCTHLVSELHHGDKAVAAGPVPALGSGILPRRERGQRSPLRISEGDRNARAGIAEGLDDISVQPLKPIDSSPGGAPGPEVRGQLVSGSGQLGDPSVPSYP